MTADDSYHCGNWFFGVKVMDECVRNDGLRFIQEAAGGMGDYAASRPGGHHAEEEFGVGERIAG
jgi:hypothetical protein